MKEKNNKRIILVIVFLIILILAILGLTYAYYRANLIKNEAETSVEAGTKVWELTYVDGEPEIVVEDLVEPSYVFTKQFSVTNTGSVPSGYSVVLDNIESNFSRYDWSYKLYSGNLADEENLLKEGKLVISTTANNNLKDRIEISDEIILEKGGVNNHLLVLTYENKTEDQSNDMDKRLSLRVNISDPSKLAQEKVQEGTLLAQMLENIRYVPSDLLGKIKDTSAFGSSSLSSEAIITDTQDDYGTSYYLKGNIENNYINYSGMCWRIVRVDGNGNTKIVLADGSGECNSSTYSITNDESSFINNSIAFSKFTGVDAEVDFTSSNNLLVPELDSWSKNLDASKLLENEWCIDTSIYRENCEHDEVTRVCRYYYGANERLKVNYSPSLKCNMDGVKLYKHTVGLLSADEISLAGIKFGTANEKTYLRTNSTAYKYWTLTPSYALVGISEIPQVWGSSGTTLSPFSLSDNFKAAIRPSVVLSATTKITNNGNLINSYEVGSYRNPYIVN